jgi:hypothetical protein
VKEGLARAIEDLQPRDPSDRAKIAEWLLRIAHDYLELRDHIAGHPSPAELRAELRTVAKVAGLLAELQDGLSDAALELLTRPLGQAGQGLDEAREAFGVNYPSPADQLRRIGLRSDELTGGGLPMLLRALAGLSEVAAARIPVSRGSRREHIARRDPFRELVLACGDVILSRGIEVRAHLLTSLSTATHEQAEPAAEAADQARLKRLSEHLAPKLRRWRELMSGPAMSDGCRVPNRDYFALLAKLGRETSHELGRQLVDGDGLK